MQKPKVLVEVEEGVATTSTVGDVEVLIVDYDILDMGESLQIPETFFAAFAGLREAVGARSEEPEVKMKRPELLPDDLKDQLPGFFAQDDNKDPIVYVKFCCSRTQWLWFVIEGEAEGDDVVFFGYVICYTKTWSYFSLKDLLNIIVPAGALIERDESFTPKPVSQIPEITTHHPPVNANLASFQRL